MDVCMNRGVDITAVVYMHHYIEEDRSVISNKLRS